jgi:rhodanese-related sulfurtransferase
VHTLRRTGSISPQDLAGSLDGYVVIDVRDRADWIAGHVAGAVHVPVAELATGDWDDPEPHLPAGVFANSEEQAWAAVGILRRRGRDAVMVTGGARAWRAGGHCLVTNKYK